jgi:hypothetical protein
MFTSIVLYKKNKNKNDRNLEFQTKKNWNWFLERWIWRKKI